MVVRIAVDAMGGDFAPEEILKGVRESLSKEIHFYLTGTAPILEQKCSELNLPGERVHIVSSTEVVGMAESPSLSLRHTNSSIQVGLRMVKNGEVDAFISAGNTGAIMAASILILGTLGGVKRPPLAAPLPGKSGGVLLLDSGANVDCVPMQYLQFAQLANVYYRANFSVQSPRIALLSNGEEESKGNRVTKEAFSLLRTSELNFVGNIEGKDLLGDKAEIVICDGFEGNVALKTMEGVAEAVIQRLKEGLKKGLRFKLGSLLLKPLLLSVFKQMDYSEIGGAPLLGVNGLVLVCHGRSRAKAIKNSIRQAVVCLEKDVVGNLKSSIDKIA
jgi:glycerol-3-phosphate acyltransferase PlsX